MGWLAGKGLRDKLLAGTMLPVQKPAVKVKPRKKTLPVPPAYPSAPHVFVDLPAAARKKVAPRQSPLDIANGLIRQLKPMKPALAEFFCDKADPSAHPPERRTLAMARAARVTAPTSEEIYAVMQAYGVQGGPTQMGQTDVSHMPFLTNRNTNWSLLFSNPNTKQLAWKLIVTALEHAYLTEFAAEGAHTYPVRIYCPDGVTVLSVGHSDIPLAALPYGEADLQFYKAARVASEAGKECICVTIDTDAFLMHVAGGFTPERAFILDLPSGRVCGRLLAAAFGGTDPEVRLNAAFWMLTLGCDYSVPFTRFGLWNKSLVEKIHAAMHRNGTAQVISVDAAKGEWTFDCREAQLQIGQMPTRNVTSLKCVHTLKQGVQDALFCLRYYSFSFDADGPPYPPHPCTSRADTVVCTLPA